MRGKLAATIVAAFSVLLFIGVANAKVTTDIDVTYHTGGGSMLRVSVPLSSIGDINYTYTDSQGSLGIYTLTVKYSTTDLGSDPDVGWMTITPTLLASGTIISGTTMTKEHYQFTLPGFYLFIFVVNGVGVHGEASCMVGPVLSEPATLAILGIALATAGIVVARKKSTVNQTKNLVL
jgi:hypothetical protein